MGLIRTTRCDAFAVAGPAEAHYRQGCETLWMAGFLAARYTGRPGETRASCREWALHGEITVVMANYLTDTLVTVTASARNDNLFALYSNPADRIIAKYRRTLIARLGR